MAHPADSSRATELDMESAGDPAATASSVTAGAADVDMDTASAPYGTRSRNRTGSFRPNYAEDKDYDADMYDFDQEKSQPEPKKASRQSTGAAQADGAKGSSTTTTTSSRKAADSSRQAAAASSHNGSKEHTPAAASSSQPANGIATQQQQPSRKRKAAASQHTANGTSSSSSLTKRGGSGAQNAASSNLTWTGSNILTFTKCGARPQNGRLVADDGTVLEADDHVYLVCEPPGEPYYLGRIMEFLHQKNDASRPIDAVRINWFYRPRDIGRKVHDTRLVFATMHSDVSPLTALRGKCQVRHRVEIASTMDDYRRTPDCFWFEKLYDRYIQKNYDLIPTSNIVNVPEKVKKVLDERWKFVLVEQGRGKELTSAVKSCKRCSGYCASNDSVDCAVCQHTYHMNCVRPPLLKKPSRGFAWSCAACSRAQERKLEARHTPGQNGNADAEEDDLIDEEEEELNAADTGRSSPEDDSDAPHQGTAEQIYNASLWPWRYLGMHCKPEDALDYDDRIYPRASTRIGPRHQAAVGPWPGQPVQYVKPPEKKKGKKDKDTRAAEEAELYPDGKRPKWVQDMPPGYVARGEDPVDPSDPKATSMLLWKPPADEDKLHDVTDFINKSRGMAKELGLPERSTNVQDVALRLAFKKDYDTKKAMEALKTTDRKEFKEPNPTGAEQKRFEEAVVKYGSELTLVTRHVKSMKFGQITRYYYTWKKSERGESVRSSRGQKGKKQAKRAEEAASKATDDVADDDDDSAFDSGKATDKKRAFMCQFCQCTTSRRWRRAPNATAGLVNENGVKASSKEKGNQYVVALCTRCAELWRRYAIRWEDVDEITKKVAQGGSKSWKRKADEDLLRELQAANDRGLLTPDRPESPTPAPAPAAAAVQEPPRKKLKGAAAASAAAAAAAAAEREAESDGANSAAATTAAASAGAGGATAPAPSSSKKKEKEKAPEAPAIPALPKPRMLPCAVCDQMEPIKDHVSCRECRLSVHRTCYGIPDHRSSNKWTCDMCVNDRHPQVSTNYKCVLCPVEHTEQELIEQPKLTHHKKKMSEKDRERERLEVNQARKALELYRKRQEELNRPLNPREPLKRTADSNWVHVTCAVFTTEVKFGSAKALEPSEGIPSIPRSKYAEVCRGCNETGGACITCITCRAPFHVECARRVGHVLAFDIIPVKSTRRDQAHIVTFKNESGVMAPGLWCKDQVPAKTIMHHMYDRTSDNGGLSALQVYVQNYKQADLTLTGTMRKANLMSMAAKMSGTAMQASSRRLSTTAGMPNGGTSAVQPKNGDVGDYSSSSGAAHPGDKTCVRCGVDVSPRWWPVDTMSSVTPSSFHAILGRGGSGADDADRYGMQKKKYQCHKCHAARLPAKPPSPRPHHSVHRPSWSPRDVTTRSRLPDSGGIPPAASAPNVRSPERLVALEPQRDMRQPPHAWPQPTPPSIHSVVHGSQAPQTPSSVPRPPPSHSFSPPSRQPSSLPGQHVSAYGDWSARQQASPPRFLNSGPPPNLPNGPASLTALSPLRPPNTVVGGPPPPPLGHSHGGPPSLLNGRPPSSSPHIASAAPPPPPSSMSGYPSPYHHHTPPPTHALPAHHGLGNSIPPPAHHRHDPYGHHHHPHPHPHHGHSHSHGLPPARPPLGGSHGSPLGTRAGLPPPHETSSVSPILGGASRSGNDSRPASGASANPSLRNLLS